MRKKRLSAMIKRKQEEEEEEKGVKLNSTVS